jgi:hypothetical protein
VQNRIDHLVGFNYTADGCCCYCNSRDTRQADKQYATCLCRAQNLWVSRGRLIVLLPLLPIEPYCRGHTWGAQSVACLGLQYKSV